MYLTYFTIFQSIHIYLYFQHNEDGEKESYNKTLYFLLSGQILIISGLKAFRSRSYKSIIRDRHLSSILKNNPRINPRIFDETIACIIKL